jgi:hypothetical protein
MRIEGVAALAMVASACAMNGGASSIASIRPRCRRRAGTPVGGAGRTLAIVIVASGERLMLPLPG